MRSLLAVLLWCSSLQAQTWTAVAAPTQPLVSGFQLEQSQLSNHTWLYPFTMPAPAGSFEVSNAIIDRSQRLGVWSKPKPIIAKSGWFLYGGSWNQAATSDDAGIAWRVKVISVTDFEYNPLKAGSEHYFYVGWSGQYLTNTVAPYSFTIPRLQELKQDPRRLFRLGMLQPGGRNTVVAPAPDCYASNLPLVPMDIAWCRVTETGETQLSPSFSFVPPAPHAGWTQAETCELPFGLQEQHPHGTIGYHVYVRLLPEKNWRRVPAPHCYGEPSTVDDWLFQWHDRQPKVHRLATNAPVHSPAAAPRSRLNTLQLALKNTADNVQVAANAVMDATCPVIDEWRASPPTFGRRVSSKDGGKWSIRQQPSQSGHKYWPVLAIENSYSQWVGLEVQGNGTSAAVSFGDFSGGQAFGNQFERCNFFAPASGTGFTCGVLVDAKCTGQFGSHTASELSFRDCQFNGLIPIWLGGNQTANVRFDRTHASSFAGNDRRASAIYLECPNQVRFTGGLYTDCPNGSSILRASTYNAKLIADDIWVDQGFQCLIEACGVAFDVKLAGGKLNVRGAGPVLARMIDQHYLSKLLFSDIDVQLDPGVAGLSVINGSYNQVELRFTDTYLSEAVTLREPSKDQTSALLKTIFYDSSLNATDVPVPGMKLNVPSVSTSVTNQATVATDQSVVFNSFTGRQQVKRANWTD